MRIRDIQLHTVSVPVTRTGYFSKRVVESVDNTIVEIETDEGIVGIGETREHWSAEIIRTRFSPSIVGLSALDRPAVRTACLPKEPFDYGYPEHLCHRNAYAAVDTALWDIAGKAAGKPLYELLGGAVRERALFCGYAYSDNPHAGLTGVQLASRMAEIAEHQIEETGAGLFEYKIGLHALDCEIGIARAVRAALGENTEIAVDANMGFSKDQALAFLDGVRDVRFANIEEPVGSLSDMEEVRARTGVPVSTHCYDRDTLARYPLIDAIVVDPQLVGGITGFLEQISVAEALGKKIWLRARWELGVAWAVFCHLGIACAALDRPNQALIDWIEDDLVLGDRWRVKDGGVRPPDSPGFGVELDRAAMKRYSVWISSPRGSAAGSLDIAGMRRSFCSRRNGRRKTFCFRRF